MQRFSVETNGSLSDIAAGPDGNMWFTAVEGSDDGVVVGKITTAGVVTKYSSGFHCACGVGLAAGADGNVWFTGDAHHVGRITPSGTVTSLHIPGKQVLEWDIAAGPDGNMWITTGDGVGRITMSGAFRDFSSASTSGARRPNHLTAGPDGNIWFTQAKYGVGRITPAGVITQFPDDPDGDSFGRIAPGPDGNLYVTSDTYLYRLATNGVLTSVAINAPGYNAVIAGPEGHIWYFAQLEPDGDGKVGLVVDRTPAGAETFFQETDIPLAAAPGPDGNVWYVSTTGTIVRITPGPSITDFAVPTSPGGLYRIVGGPDHNLWFTDTSDGTVRRVSPSNPFSITEFSTPAKNSNPQAIAVGSDGNLWFPEYTGNKIAKITASGKLTEYGGLSLGAGATGITNGPGTQRVRTLWFTEFTGNRIAKITTAGVVTEYPIPTHSSGPANIVAGPDNNLWFTERSANKIGRYNPTTNSFTEYPLPTAGAAPDVITVGPDDALWFTERGANSIGRISTSGVITSHTIPTANSAPESIVSGPDGALWFTENSGSAIGRITVAGNITEYPIPTAAVDPDGLTVGPDGNLWFTEYNAHRIGRLLPAPASAMVLPSGPAPATRSVPLGSTVQWIFQAGGTDSITDSSGFGLFTSPNLPPANYYAHAFATAGTYTYSTGTGRTGQISVPPTATAVGGTMTTSVYVRWAESAPLTGDVFDIGIRPPGSKRFVPWQTGVTTTASSYTPTTTGAYGFEARMRNLSTGSASLYAATQVIVKPGR